MCIKEVEAAHMIHYVLQFLLLGTLVNSHLYLANLY